MLYSGEVAKPALLAGRAAWGSDGSRGGYHLMGGEPPELLAKSAARRPRLLPLPLEHPELLHACLGADFVVHSEEIWD